MKNIYIGIIGYEKKFSVFYKHALKKNSIYKIKFLIKKNLNKKSFNKKIYEELKNNKIKFLVSCNKKYNSQIIRLIDFLIKKKIVIVQASTNHEIKNHGYIIQKYFKDFSFRDIFLREALRINKNLIAKDINSKKILISGGGGSIGSNLVLNLLKFNPKKLIVIDNNEYAIFRLKEILPNKVLNKISFKILDINYSHELEIFIQKSRPDIIFHTAALKHVGFLEENPIEGIKTNVFGTKNILDASIKYKVKKFVHISTDKSAEPKNILGISKLFSEIICTNAVTKTTKIGIVRFGNVFDSNGSVSEIFRNKIINNQKIYISHKFAERFFMSKDESSYLLLSIQNYLNNKEKIQMFTHDMGAAVNISELAKKMIFLSGRNPDKIISKNFTGLNNGEKLKEKLLNKFEAVIFKDKNNIIKFSSHNDFAAKKLLNKLRILFNKNWSVKKINSYIKTIKAEIFSKLSS
jgi:FlaA1/EpsC-like NDP-sugar epimerase